MYIQYQDPLLHTPLSTCGCLKHWSFLTKWLSLPLPLPQFPVKEKNAPAAMHVPLFTLCLQFALHILRPRPRRYAGLRDKSHTQKGREREKDRGGGVSSKRYGETRREGGWGGEIGLTLFTAMQLWSAFEAGWVLWQPLSLFLSPSLSVL